MTDFEHEVAVLRPKRGDVIVVYADPLAFDPIMMDAYRDVQDKLEAGGVQMLILPPVEAAARIGGASEVQRLLNDGLQRLGFRAVPL